MTTFTRGIDRYCGYVLLWIHCSLDMAPDMSLFLCCNATQLRGLTQAECILKKKTTISALEPKILSEKNQRINCFISPAPQPIQWKEEKHCVNPSLLSTFILFMAISPEPNHFYRRHKSHEAQFRVLFFFLFWGTVFCLHKTENRKELSENGWVLNKQPFSPCSIHSDGGL